MTTITYVKYPNRRIYDTENSGYVSFQSLRKKILEGREILVLDHKTKEDVTREVLISIIMEETIGGEPLFSNDLMKMIIRSYGNPMQDLLMSALDQSQKILNTVLHMATSSMPNKEK
jgi:polyhydroxyalkanoate synthesis repressor PhaR